VGNLHLPFLCSRVHPSHTHTLQNVVGIKYGATNPDEVVVVGGHYDSTSQVPWLFFVSWQINLFLTEVPFQNVFRTAVTRHLGLLITVPVA
jgi:hypothetical protein